MLSHLLDTSIYSQRLRPQPIGSVVDRWKELGDSVLAISSICEAELHYGLSKKNSCRLWKEYHEFLENRLTLLPVDGRVAARYGSLKALREAEGKPVADFDLLIGATALEHGLCLATLNPRHFSGLPGLSVENWG
jgi:tRNA(fMet)-specific endonuclease VapC